MGIVIRQSIKATLINYIGAFLGFIITMFVLTRFLKPEEIGLTKVIYEVAFLISGFAQLGVNASAMRFFPYFRDAKHQNHGFFFYLMLLPALGGIIFISVYFLLEEPIQDFFSKNSSLFLAYYNWVPPLMFFVLFWSVLEVYSNLLMRIVIPKFIREIALRCMLLVVYLLYAFHFLDLTGLVTGFVAVYGIAMLLTYTYVARIGSVSLRHDFSYINKPLRKKILKYTLYLVVGALGGNIIAQLDLFMVSSQMGLTYAGIYTIALYIAAVIEMPARSLTAISSPLAAAALKEGDLEKANQLYQKVALHQLIGGSVIFLLIWINIDNIFAVIPNGEVYRAGKWVVFFIAMAKLIWVTLSFGSTLISFSRYYYWGLYFTFFLSGLTIYTNYLLIPRLGVTGAAIATLITCLISYSLQQWIVLKKIKGNPYTFALLKQILLILFLFACNALLPRWSSNPFADAFYRSLPIGVLWVILTYKFRISEEICSIFNKYIRRK